MGKKEDSWEHIETLNREMGEVKSDVTWLKTTLDSMNRKIEKIDSKVLYILVGIGFAILIQILTKVL